MSSTTLSLAYSRDDSILAVGLSDTTVQVHSVFLGFLVAFIKADLHGAIFAYDCRM